MRLILIRHGQTPANVLGSLDTARPGPGLTALGEEQARAVPAALNGQPLDALYASTLVRTQLTAALGGERGLTAEVREGLHEIEAGDLEGRTDRDSVHRYLHTMFAWGTGDLDVTMPGGYNGHEFFDRFTGDLSDIAASGAETAAVVSHGAAIRVWVAAYAQNIAPVFTADNALDNTGIVVLDGSFEHGWTLRRWQDQPLGGEKLTDATASDPSSETLAEARAEFGSA